ncbi:LOW QUALITY PROTEIN: transcriptional activator hap3 [Lolium perenne]|uniref:LOW QUALITY PROTEIN: transcriptional activator hap3 n=1 Tax=Lolium perenne TaxID=4522 RepID=UPI0021F645D6|nr:nuclear transcription factor Y subunit B-4-like [Lolium perenne]
MSREDFINFSGFTQPGRLSVPRASTLSLSSVPGDVNAQGGLLPIANIGRIMKGMLPPEAKVSKSSKETMQECATEFIGFVTGEASERCRRERRKTMNGDDICHAMKSLGLDHYAGAMHRYLQRYREGEELAAALNNSIRAPPADDDMIQIDVRAQLSISRGQEKHGRN